MEHGEGMYYENFTHSSQELGEGGERKKPKTEEGQTITFHK